MLWIYRTSNIYFGYDFVGISDRGGNKNCTWVSCYSLVSIFYFTEHILHLNIGYLKYFKINGYIRAYNTFKTIKINLAILASRFAKVFSLNVIIHFTGEFDTLPKIVSVR